MRKIIKNPEGYKSFKTPGQGFGLGGAQFMYTGQEAKEAIVSFIIDFFFEKKHGEMYIPGGLYPETITEDRACDLVGEFFNSFDFATARKLAFAGFYPTGEDDNLYSDGSKFYIRKNHIGWSLRPYGGLARYFSKLEDLLEYLE